ncbi:tRNA (guanosine(46)-N7)-methyltransferase TrmB [Peptoniphilus raoultii]|uniref:tRNA (guanosine(46)-N7)-methyltransferase TrmB n=1 Tax=Peptoniphilus raoultii TaxID=1776387 RepID=UPI0008D94FCA|nr:tRNA (guanosine(46)-N7)-methyltransferase TrmB [Peptoniphilus raoultii]
MRLRKKHFAIPEMKENPFVFYDGEKYKGKWMEVFENNNPIYLELGAGKGTFTAQSAMDNPNINYIMVEMESNAFIYGTRKILEYKLTNVRALPIKAENILNYFEDEEISRIYINFCTPWPKLKHQKRRLTYPDFLKKYKVILKDGGDIYLKTDDRDFFEDSLKYFEDQRFMEVLRDFDMKEEEYPLNIVTEYERKWRDQNKPICFGVFEKYVD